MNSDKKTKTKNPKKNEIGGDLTASIEKLFSVLNARYCLPLCICMCVCVCMCMSVCDVSCVRQDSSPLS
ncbi:unnamed protein product [Onchocerca flexuosa]|uniref:Transmembrane protein n=1 Tax=Onchocerca flexuosa TaxID=387005 RepID=A0A183HGH0_9BILA|nr:unnamed protein product [Onchocerca flexuosa]